MIASTIVHITTFLQGGAGRVVTDLACAQRAFGHRVIVAASATPEPGYESYPEYFARLEDAGVDVVIADSSFKRDRALNARMAHALRVQLAGETPAIIHAHAAVPARIGRATAFAPVVQTMHGWSLGKAAEYVAEDLATLADVEGVVFPSTAARQALLDLGARPRWDAVVPCGLALASPHGDLPPTLATVLARRARGSRVLVTIGSLTAQKNHRTVVAALPAIRQRYDAELVLVGEGPEIAAIRELAAAVGVADHVHCLGYVREAADVLATADLLIQPSLIESFGMAVAEAFRARVPVVASNIAALNELVIPGLTGWRFDPGRDDALSAAVIEALATSTETREALVDRAETFFREQLTVDRMVERYQAIYRDAATPERLFAASSTADASSSTQNP